MLEEANLLSVGDGVHNGKRYGRYVTKDSLISQRGMTTSFASPPRARPRCEPTISVLPTTSDYLIGCEVKAYRSTTFTAAWNAIT